jgi:hypothetical protein
VNIAGFVKGTQVGLVNINEDMAGIPVGLVNISTKGEVHLDLFTTEASRWNVGAKFGSRYFYTTWVASFDEPGAIAHPRDWSNSVGMGFHIPGDNYFLNFDVLGRLRWKLDGGTPAASVIVTPRLQLGWQISKHFSLVGGVTMSVQSSPAGVTETIAPTKWPQWSETDPHGESVRVWPGYYLGIQF